jgi:hypothetical protein
MALFPSEWTSTCVPETAGLLRGGGSPNRAGQGLKNGGPVTGKHMKNRFVCLLLALGTLTAALVSPAWGLRCGSRLISEGDPKEKLLEACGRPAAIETWEEERDYIYPTAPYDHPGTFHEYGDAFRVRVRVTVEEWVYNHGPSRFIDYVRIENGRVRSIRSGGYGY